MVVGEKILPNLLYLKKGKTKGGRQKCFKKKKKVEDKKKPKINLMKEGNNFDKYR